MGHVRVTSGSWLPHPHPSTTHVQYEGRLFLFSAGLQSCLQQALRSFDQVLLTPQLDDGSQTFRSRAMVSSGG